MHPLEDVVHHKTNAKVVAQSGRDVDFLSAYIGCKPVLSLLKESAQQGGGI